MADALFDVRPVPRPPQLTAGERRRERHRRQFAYGWHPLGEVLRTTLRLHAEAAPVDDRAAAGRRCGSCRFRLSIDPGATRRFPKCVARDGARITHSDATDVRAWWPACVDHEYADPVLGPDAARWVPPVDGPDR